MKSYLPIIVKYSPIRKLAIIPFEKSPDAIYRGFELQYIEGEPYGSGYRVLAYRNDQYVDVYDDMALNFIEDETFHVVENGLHKHIQTQMSNVKMYKNGNNQFISFEFTDIKDRKISVHIEENSTKKSKEMNLLAPIGSGSKAPDYLPVFFLYRFDFIRKRKSMICCNIDGKEIKIDTFPLPMNGQSRFYIRYSNECELFEFANTSMGELQEVELDANHVYRDGNIEYFFLEKNILKKVLVHYDKQNVLISFGSGLSLEKSCVGEFLIKPREQMGYIKGEYSVQCNQHTTIMKMIPSCGWVSKPNSIITSFVLGTKSVFCTWTKKYRYEANIDLSTRKVEACWVNENH